MDCFLNHINEWDLLLKGKDFDFIFNLLWYYSWIKLKRNNFIVIYYVVSFDMTEKCDGLWLPVAKSFPTVYYMNDFAPIIFSRYYTCRW